jgi:ATP-dependent RNA helicase RhlE
VSQLSFRALGVSDPVADVLAARSIERPFRIQSLVLPDALAGLDVVAKSPTGSGKTLAFAIPIVERTTPQDARASALVLVPTRELAGQVTEELRSLAAAKGLKVASVYGGVPLRSQAAEARTAHVLVATPGRLEDLAQRKLIDLSRIRILILDEADRMLDMGFRPQVDRIVRRVPSNRQTMFFSATLDGEVGELARSYTSSPARFEAQAPVDRAEGEIEHRFISVSQNNKVETLVDHLRAEDGLTLIFVRTKRGADRLVRKLRAHGVKAEAMHGDMSQSARQRALRRFESANVPVLVATDVAARGLDIDDIEHVINFDPPEEDKGYLHRTGRTGRAG